MFFANRNTPKNMQFLDKIHTVFTAALTPPFSYPPLCQTPRCRSLHSRSTLSPSHPVLLRTAPSRFSNMIICFGNRPPLIRRSVPAHKSLLVRNVVSMFSHRVISRARLYEVIRWPVPYSKIIALGQFSNNREFRNVLAKTRFHAKIL